MWFTEHEVFELIRMVEVEHLDIRTVTLALHVRDCAASSVEEVAKKIEEKILFYASSLLSVCQEVEEAFGIPIVNKRLALTPLSLLADSLVGQDLLPLALRIDQAGEKVGVDYIGGFSALVHKGFTKGELHLIRSIPEVLSSTKRLCSSVNVASTKSGINMDAVHLMAAVIQETAEKTKAQGGIGCAKLVVFANMPEDNPFVAGACAGMGEPECTVNIGVSGPGVIRAALEKLPKDASLGEVAELLKRLAFKITRAGELIGREVAKRLGLPFGIVDLSLAPTPALGDSIANIIEVMGIESCGAFGTTAALALLTDAVKKGGAMAGSYVGGLSGAFIPVSEDAGMVQAAKKGSLSLEKLEAMTSVCSVGLDMVAIPGDTPIETIAAIIADEMAIGVVNQKTTAVRIIPVPGGKVGEEVKFGGLLGNAYVMEVNPFSAKGFIQRGGRIPPPIQSLNN